MTPPTPASKEGSRADRWQPEDIALVFSTCPREPSYFSTTLASALVADPLTIRLRSIGVAVDAPDLACAAALTGHSRIVWSARDAEESARADALGLHRRACYNYWRALGLAAAGARAVFACEDDVIFRDGWLAKLLECLDEMQDRGLSEFILTAYSTRDHEEPQLRRGRCYSSYVARCFYATQAMLYPASEAIAIRSLLWKNGVER